MLFLQRALSLIHLLMKNSYELGQDQFDALLGLFSADRDEAGERYEHVRRGLVRYFQFKGCQDPDSLADETINRVASKIDRFDPAKSVDPAAYFYGFAVNVFLEYRRASRKELSLTDFQYGVAEIDADSDIEIRIACLEKCLGKLPTDEKELAVNYYPCAGREKIELRKEIFERLNCSAAALHTRVFRIRAGLRQCIDACTKLSS